MKAPFKIRLSHSNIFIHDGLCIEQWVKGIRENVSKPFQLWTSWSYCCWALEDLPGVMTEKLTGSLDHGQWEHALILPNPRMEMNPRGLQVAALTNIFECLPWVRRRHSGRQGRRSILSDGTDVDNSILREKAWVQIAQDSVHKARKWSVSFPSG